jgi:hypothetical protein
LQQMFGVARVQCNASFVGRSNGKSE